jgi:hypothetical protein
LLDEMGHVGKPEFVECVGECSDVLSLGLG